MPFGCSRPDAPVQRPVPPPVETPPAARVSAPAQPPAHVPDKPQPAPTLPPIVPTDSAWRNSWLTVEEVRAGAESGCATGGYDRSKNRITIETEGVLQFRMDTDTLSVDYSRPVVLRIDGYNCQLVEHDTPRLHFRVTPTGDWELQRK